MPAAPVRSRPQHILVTTRTFCTILSTNYLPKALALAESLRQHEDGTLLHILFIDVAHDDGSPQLDRVVSLSTQVLGLPERRCSS
jgi:hypothetical protein